MRRFYKTKVEDLLTNINILQINNPVFKVLETYDEHNTGIRKLLVCCGSKVIRNYTNYGSSQTDGDVFEILYYSLYVDLLKRGLDGLSSK